MSRGGEPRFRYRAVITGPTGETLPWTESAEAEKAKQKLTRLPWEFAVRHGYKLTWIQDYVSGR